MRKWIWLMFMGGCIIMSCAKEGDIVGVYKLPFWGYVNGTLNGTKWTSDIYAIGRESLDTVTLNMINQTSHQGIEEHFYLSNLPTAPGHYLIGEGHDTPLVRISSFLVYGGDVIGESWEYIQLVDSGYVDIALWQPEVKHIGGNFKATLVKDLPYYLDSGYPDTIHIEGKFFTRVADH